MNKAKLVLRNFDAKIPKIEIKTRKQNFIVIISSKIYDEKTEERGDIIIRFADVAAIDFRVNFFDCLIGSEAYGLYCIKDKTFIKSVTKSIFERRKEVYILEGGYNYDENDEYDMLNCFDTDAEFSNNIEEYSAYIQNVDGGVYIIIAKDIFIEK